MKSLVHFLIIFLMLYKISTFHKESSLMFSPFLTYEYGTKLNFNFFYDQTEADLKEYILLDYLFIRNNTQSEGYEDFKICKGFSTFSSCEDQDFKKIKDYSVFSKTKLGENCGNIINDLLCYSKCNSNKSIMRRDQSFQNYVRISHSTCLNLFLYCNKNVNATDYIDFCQNKLNLPKLRLTVTESTFLHLNSSQISQKENIQTLE